MRKIFGLVVVAAVVFVTGCSAQESTDVSPPAELETQAASDSLDATSIEGSWVGEQIGYEKGVLKETEVRYLIEESAGGVFSGTKSWRELGGQWSEAEVFEGAFIDSQQFYATDSDGLIVGKMTSSNSITATYLESGDDQGAFAENLTRTTQ